VFEIAFDEQNTVLQNIVYFVSRIRANNWCVAWVGLPDGLFTRFEAELAERCLYPTRRNDGSRDATVLVQGESVEVRQWDCCPPDRMAIRPRPNAIGFVRL
jgi:hypothetical protein